jgi:3-hydroxyacyl-CoA dehydrogenase
VTGAVTIDRDGNIGVIQIDRPPVNALAQSVREALLWSIEYLEERLRTRAIVLHGVGRNFSAGADVRELEQPRQAPLLSDVLLRLERCAIPVVAALHGAVLGGAAETALACHYRCAGADLLFGFPEIKLGLLPGAGGTVRLPRAIDLTVALEMMISGDPIGLPRALELGLIDRVTEGEPRVAALAYTRELLQAGAGVRRLREHALRNVPVDTVGFFRNYRLGLPSAIRRLRASESIVQCVEAAVTRPFEIAQARACELFEECRNSSESAAQRRLFLAERASGVRTFSRLVESVGVIGAGTMGSGIATSFAQSGFEVVFVDANEQAVRAGLERIHANLDNAAHRGHLSSSDAASAKLRVRGALQLSKIATVDLVIEAITEDLAAKRQLFAQLGVITKPGAVLATNTSTLDIDELAAASRRPDDLAGMHFFSPAHIMRLVEVVRGRSTSSSTLKTVLAVSRRIGKIGVVVGNGFGFVGNRMLYAYGRENELMLLEGATPEAIDRALESFGMAMGPNVVGDLAGLDIGVTARRAWKDRPDDPRFYRISDLLVELGRFGQKYGRGFYRYDELRHRWPDPEVVSVIRTEARRLGVAQRDVPDQEIIERCIFAMINEGARVLQEGIASKATDIDVIWCNGYGFPRHLGGPMFHADTVGLDKLVSAIRDFARQHGERYWTVAPLLNEVGARGRRLADWTGREPERSCSSDLRATTREIAP